VGQARTARTSVSIEASKGREVFLRSRIEVTPATIVDGVTGEVLGETSAAELMTIGQRRGVLPGRDGEKRFVSKVDIAAQRVEVGRLDEILISTIHLDEPSCDFLTRRGRRRHVVLAQWSAHGRPQLATLRHDRQHERPWSLHLHAPARPVAPGQTVVLYRVSEPEIVEGAAIVTGS